MGTAGGEREDKNDAGLRNKKLELGKKEGKTFKAENKGKI